MRDRLIVALDTDDASRAMTLARELRDAVDWVKVGMTLFYSAGPTVVPELLSSGLKVFVDLKLHDIPHQVAGATRTLAGFGAGMITVHASGGGAMVKAAAEAATDGALRAGLPRPAVLAVTVLTSLDAPALAACGVDRPPLEQVLGLALMACEAGADGVVCSPAEAAAVRELLGPEALVVTPGVRPARAALGDQARVATPRDALLAGASHLVVGRPITASEDPLRAAREVLREMAEE